MTTNLITVIGENIIDLVPDPDQVDDAPYRARAGGSPANIAVSVAKLGSRAALAARVSRDVFGGRIRERLTDAGVDARYLVDAAEPSSLAVVTFDAERRASYDFWLNGTADWQWRDRDLPNPLGEDVGALHIGSLAAYLSPGAEMIEKLVAREGLRGRVTLSFDPNIRPTIVAAADGSLDAARVRTERLVRLVDVVKVSDEDLGWLYPDVPAEDAAAEWAEIGPALVVVTRGSQGALAIGRAATVTVPAPKVTVADTIGAGDSFAGALLHALDVRGLLGPGGADRIAGLDTETLTEVIRTATTAAALTCTRIGADPPTAAELEAALKE
ncbi:carbohydrate kinase family protein [Cryptosporangium aurantiacum]|uniref:Fructokinase n=1 Tax=Cryptosporangium aurantiacum TaxID=134849 RepID=A0A1M7QRK6_9ACTN|nr:carbohydrate kinase [Cryptosporangium aurantiacum]SHN34315.1 fructokinase [Cryptosporangium aurantiacum]